MARAPRLGFLGAVACLGLLAYIWFDALSNGWGWGWALFGTFNITVAALVLLGLGWLVARILRRSSK